MAVDSLKLIEDQPPFSPIIKYSVFLFSPLHNDLFSTNSYLILPDTPF
jgi:hypothetical protein